MALAGLAIITRIRCICWLSSAFPMIVAFDSSVEVGDATSGSVESEVSRICLDFIWMCCNETKIILNVEIMMLP